MGRIHTLYTREIAEEILERLAEGESLKSICRLPGMPTDGAVRKWAINDHDGFGSRYARAREIGLHGMVDEMLEIADAAKDVDSASAARVQVETRKWALAKLLPAVFGDRVQVTHSLDPARAMTAEERAARIRELSAPRPLLALPQTIDGSATTIEADRDVTGDDEGPK